MSAPVTVTINATTFTFTGPTSGNVNSASTNFTVTPNNSYTGTITITPSGTGSSGLSPTVLTFSSSTAQTFTITPTNSGSITLTPTNNGGLTNPSNIVYTANAVVPGVPTSVVATPLNHGASVTFVAPASNGGSAIIGYTVTASSGGTDSNAGSTSLTHTVTGLTNGTSYTFTVKATNSIGEGLASSASSPVTPLDTTAPTVTAFSIPSTSSSLTVSISSFTASDNNAVTGYLLTESSSAPLASDGGWSGTAPTSYTFSTQGSKTLYAWAKDAAGNVSTSMSAGVTVDTTSPSITNFSIPVTSSSLNVDISTFTATDNVGVTGYLITESSSAPLSSDSGWTGTAPTSYMFVTEGSKVLYAWVKDAIGHVSTSLNASTVITLPADSYSFGGPSTGTVQAESSNFTVIPNSVYTGTITVTPTGSASVGLSPIILTFSNSATAQTFKVTPTVSGTLILTPTNSSSLTDHSSLTYIVTNAPDLTAPTVTAFSVPSTSSSLTVSISSFTASDNNAVTGYLINESSSSPLAGDSGWSGTAPTTYTFSTQGSKTLYAWAKDAAGNVSISMSAPVMVTLDLTPPSDTTSPIISNTVSNPSSNGILITWNTDELASSFVDYGLTTSYGTSTSEIDLSPRVTNHSISLSNLVSCSTYHYRVLSTDGDTNQATGDDNIFTTTGCTGGATVGNQNSSNITHQSGGTVNLNSDGNSITLVVPPSFSINNADFQIKQLNKSETLGTTSVPTGYLTIGSYVYDLKALSDNSTAITSFDNPLTVTLSYTSSDVIGMNESSLKIYRWDGSVWTALTNCSVDTNLKTVTCNTNHFSVFSLFGQAVQIPYISGSGGGGSTIIYGCTDPLALNYQTSVMSNPVLCKYPIKQNIITAISGCKDLNALNYDNSAIGSDISLCKYSTIKKSIESNFTRDLKLGMEGSDVKLLQEYLNSHGFIIAKSGAGSKGKEVDKFGPSTKAALIRFQKSKGITPANGYFGPKTREFVNN